MFMMGSDPLSWGLMLIGLPLVFLPQWWVKHTISQYEKVDTAAGMRGVDVARDILERQNIRDVDVEQSEGFLSDHYDPGAKKVRLSPEIYNGRSISSVAVAAHEVGHAIQHATGYYPVVLRSAMVPAVNLGSSMGPLLILGGFILLSTRILSPDLALLVAFLGVIGYGLAVAFHFVTLPVEINASMRALAIVKSGQYLTTTEQAGAKAVLTAAAATYVATALYALMQLMYYVMQLIGLSRRD